MARGTPLSDEMRAHVLSILLTGVGVRETARRLNLPTNTVQNIKRTLSEEQLVQVGTETREKLDDLLLGCVRVHVQGMNRIAEAATEANYVAGQSAESLAALHQELSATAFEILAAASEYGVADYASDEAAEAE